MTTALEFPARVIRDALTPIPPGREVTVDHLRPAFEAAQLRPGEVHAAFDWATTHGWLNPVRIAGYRVYVPTTHAPGKGRAVRLYTRGAVGVDAAVGALGRAGGGA